MQCHVASLGSSSSNKALPAAGKLCNSPDICAVSSPCLAFTVSDNTLNKCFPLQFFTLRCWWLRKKHFHGSNSVFSMNFSRIDCCFSSREEWHFISSDWALISSVCQRCNCANIYACIQCSISSSVMSASSVSLPYMA